MLKARFIKILTKENDNVIENILEDKMIKIPKWLISYASGIDKFETINY